MTCLHGFPKQTAAVPPSGPEHDNINGNYERNKIIPLSFMIMINFLIIYIKSEYWHCALYYTLVSTQKRFVKRFTAFPTKCTGSGKQTALLATIHDDVLVRLMHLDLVEHVSRKTLHHVVPDIHCQVFSCAAQQETGVVLGKLCVYSLTNNIAAA